MDLWRQSTAAAATAAALGVIGACGSNPLPGPPRGDAAVAEDGPALCAAQTGGALITFQACGDLFTVWVTRRPFIEEAQRVAGTGRSRIPVFTLRDGQRCDPRWTWHVDPATALFADATIELCQGCPAFVESDKSYWINKVKSYCPMTAAVVQVDHRR